MKFDPDNWHEVSPNQTYEATQSLVCVRADKPVSLFVTSRNGVEALAGTGLAVQVSCANLAEYTITGPKDARVFVEAKAVPVYVPDGEVWSNADRRPLVSENVAEVTRALRAFKLDAQAIRVEIARERRALEAARGKAKRPDPEPDVAPEADQLGDKAEANSGADYAATE